MYQTFVELYNLFCIYSVYNVYKQTYSNICQIVSCIKGRVSLDFRPLFFPCFKPIWASFTRAEIFSNSVSISPRYLNFLKATLRCVHHTEQSRKQNISKKIQSSKLTLVSKKVSALIRS